MAQSTRKGRAAGSRASFLLWAGLALWFLIQFLGAPRPAHGQDDAPPEVLSWRHQVLERSEYEQLAERWARFAADHPKDPRGWVEWGDALRYAGKWEESSEKYHHAFSLDSLDAGAVVAFSAEEAGTPTGQAWRNAHDRLIRLVQREPDHAPAYYILWTTALRAGDREMAKHCLLTMVEMGDLPKPLLEFGRNLVEGAPRDAILFTNGDNDTYPPLAYQAKSGMRTDVAIVNLSLLNSPWYIRYLREQGLPVTWTDEEIEELRPRPLGRLLADDVGQHLHDNLATANWPRPLFYSVTVAADRMRLPGGRAVEGLLIRVVPGGETTGEAAYDWNRTRELIDTVYHFDGATDSLVDWGRERAVAMLMGNYAHILARVGRWLIGVSSSDEGGVYLYRAIKILDFHGETDTARVIVDAWAESDPGSRLTPAARELIAN